MNRVGRLKTPAEAWIRDQEVTPLMAAAYFGNVCLLKLLLQAGGKPNLASNGWTALMLAALIGHAAAVQALLQAGTNSALKNKDGYTALGIALGLVQEGNYEEVIKCLRGQYDIDNGAKHAGFFQYFFG